MYMLSQSVSKRVGVVVDCGGGDSCGVGGSGCGGDSGGGGCGGDSELWW